MGRVHGMRVTMIGLAVGALAAVVPVATEVAHATQVGTLSYATVVNTDGTWTAALSTTPLEPGTAELGTQTLVSSNALIECPNILYTRSQSLNGADWIWANVGQSSGMSPSCAPSSSTPGNVDTYQTVTLTKTFYIPGEPQAAAMYMAADNGAAVSVNGHMAINAVPFDANSYTNFESVTTVSSVPLFADLVSGWNTITITAENGAGPAAVAASLVVDSSATMTNLCKDGAWMTNPAGPNGIAGFLNQGDCMSFYLANPNASDPA